MLGLYPHKVVVNTAKCPSVNAPRPVATSNFLKCLLLGVWGRLAAAERMVTIRRSFQASAFIKLP